MAYSWIRVLALVPVLALSCKYGSSTPDPEVGGTQEKSMSSPSSEKPEPANQSNGSPDEPQHKGTPDEAKRTPTEASGTCDDRSCVASQDCCSGYQCAFDPERSKVQRYCLPN